MYASALNFLCGLIEPGLHRTWPRSTASLSIPRSRQPTLSPASPESSSLRNISTPVTTDFCVSFRPTISTSSPTLILPRSIRPVATVPRPVIENTSSTGIRNGFSTLRLCSGARGCRAAAALADLLAPLAVRFTRLQRLERRALDDRDLVAGILVLGEQLAHFQLDQ